MVESIITDQPFVTLNNGIKMPQIGLGTYDDSEGDVTELLKAAILHQGYRHIDTAKVYQNEEKIGAALKEVMDQGIIRYQKQNNNREDLYIVTKLWHDEDKSDVEGALRKQLKSLQLEYVDLYLIHWMLPTLDWSQENPIGKTPNQAQTFVVYKVWQQLEHCVEIGLVKSIGVSNCTIPMLLDILAFCKIKPAVNQVELHPYLVQKEYVDFQKKLGVHVTAYAPLGAFGWPFKREEHKSLNVLKEPLIQDLAAKYERPLGQIVLNWHLHRGHVIIPKTSKIDRLRENIQCYDFKMTEEEYEQISKLNKGARFYDPLLQTGFGWAEWPYFDQ